MLPTKGNPGHKSPVEMKYGIVSNLSMFRTFGFIAYAHVAAETREKTFTSKAEKGSLSDISQYTN